MVQRLLDFKALADTTISTSFVDEKAGTQRTSASTSASTRQSNSDFVYALSDAFTTGFKARRSTPAEMIAKYLDKAMRHGQAGMSDGDFEALLDSALALYRFTDDKDVFRSFYHRSLAKRLLLQKSASDDFEASMLKKLKERKCLSVVLIVILRGIIDVVVPQNMTQNLGWARICSRIWRFQETWCRITTPSCPLKIRGVNSQSWYSSAAPGRSTSRNLPLTCHLMCVYFSFASVILRLC
jgi:hypothetical protein